MSKMSKKFEVFEIKTEVDNIAETKKYHFSFFLPTTTFTSLSGERNLANTPTLKTG